MTTFANSLIIGIASGMTFGLVALGFVLVYRATGIVNFTQGSFVAIGGMLAAKLATAEGLPAIEVLLLCMVAVGLVSVLVAVVCVVAQKTGGTLRALLVTVGLSIAFEGVLLALFGDNPVSFGSPVGNKSLHLGGVLVLPQQVLIVISVLAIVGLTQWFMGRTIWGMGMRASASNPVAARLSSIPVLKTTFAAFVIGGILAGVAGDLITPMTAMAYSSDTTWTINGFSAAIIAGLVDPIGAIAGGLVLGVVETLIGAYVSSSYETAVAMVVMLAILVLRPRGLFSWSAR
jgi:branched-chain amino acid transport system permease protein